MEWPEGLERWDRDAFLWLHRTLHGLDVPGLDAYLRWVNELGNGFVLVAVLGLWLALRPTLRSAGRAVAQAALAVTLTALATHTLKDLFDHARPGTVFAAQFRAGDLVAAFGDAQRNGSFPSGHTATAFALALVVSAWAGAIPAAGRRTFARTLAFVLAGSTGIARVYAGAHFPSDVVGGAIEGLFCATLALAFVRVATAPANGGSPPPPPRPPAIA